MPLPPFSSSTPPATFNRPGKVRQTVYNVKDYGAVGNGVTDDTTAIQAAVNAAGTPGGTVKFPPGTYLVSNIIVWDKRSSLVSVLGPSMIGADGRSGPSPDFGDLGTVRIVCDAVNFPVGEYVFDFLGPTAQDKAICGVKVAGFVFDLNSKGAGIRFFNCFDANLCDVNLADGATPNPAIPGAFAAGTSNTGMVNFSANPTQNSFFNVVERVFTQGAAVDGFQMASGAGSFDLMANCIANNCGRFGYNIVDKCTLLSCLAQANAKTNGLSGADYNIGRYDIALVNCVVYAGKPSYGPGIKLAGGASAIAHFSNCTFYGPSQAGLSESDGSILYIEGNIQSAQFVGCTFSTGVGTNTTDFVYVSQYMTGRVLFEACSFLTEYGSPLTNTPVNYNGNADLVAFHNCHGLNPNVTQSWGNLTNAQQTLQIGLTGGVPSGGTFTLTFGGQTTSALAYNASAATISAALQALSSIGAGNVSCTGGGINSHPVVVNFISALGNAAQAAITANGAGLTPAGTVTITTILPGGPAVTFDRKDGHLQLGTLTGNITPTINNGIIPGDTLTFELTQDGTGSRTVTWPGNVINGPVLTTTAGAVDLTTLSWDGTNWYKISQGLSRPASIAEGGTGNTAGAATALKSATTNVNVAAATAPNTGDALVATDSTHATWQTLPGGGNALTSNPLSQFAATTSAQLAGVLSDETGSGAAVFATSPTFVTPALGTPASGVATNLTGTGTALTAAKSGYTIFVSAASTSPADAATLYMGARSSAALGSVSTERVYIPRAGTVKAIYLSFANTGTLGTGETYTVSFRLNNTTDTTISSAVTNDAAQTAFNNIGLGITVAAGDFFEIKFVFPTWATNPTAVFPSATIYVEPS